MAKIKKRTKPITSKVNKIKQSSCHEMDSNIHPDHSNQKRRLNRVRGQLEGIDRMIVENRYCIDIITQIRAASSALKALEKEIIQIHIQSCVKTAIESKNHVESQDKIDEIMELF